MIASTGQFIEASMMSSTLAASGSSTMATSSSSSAKTSGSESTQSPKPKHRARSTSTMIRFLAETCGALIGARKLPSRPMRFRAAPALALVLALASVAAGCGKDSGGTPNQPVIGVQGNKPEAAQNLGFPQFATKNTTRIGGADPVADAAAAARAIYPGTTPDSRPDAVTLVPQDWATATAAAALMAPPVRAPLLFSDGADLPAGSEAALQALGPRGAQAVGNAQVIRVGDVARPKGLRSTDLTGKDPFALAAAVDRLTSGARGSTSDHVVVVSADEPAFGMPAAAWAAKSGDPVLFAKKDSVPAATAAALRRHEQPKIYVLGPSKAVGEKAMDALRRLGKVKRIEGPDPVRNAIAFARFIDGPFGWGVVDPGHGLVFVNRSQPLAAAAAAPVSGAGTYGPALVLDDAKAVAKPLTGYLLDIQPGYRKDPVRGVYNHGWVIGDERAVSAALQARLDALLEIVPVERRSSTS